MAEMAWKPAYNWPGLTDGNWSTFGLRIGSPPQYFYVLPSTRFTSLRLPIVAENCAYDPKLKRDVQQPLGDTDGHAPPISAWFQPSSSSTWRPNAHCHTGSDIIDDDSEGAKNHEYYSDDYRAPVEGARQEDDPLQCDHGARLQPAAFIGMNAVTSVKHGENNYWWLNGPKYIASVLQSFPLYNSYGLGYSYTAGAWYSKYI